MYWTAEITTNVSLAIWPTLDMLAAGYSATLGGATPGIDAYCPSSNCSWPLTPSLAVCGSCMPTTFERVNCSAPGTLVTNLPGYQDAQVCIYEFPGGAQSGMWDYENARVGLKDSAGTRYAFHVVQDGGGNNSNPEFDNPPRLQIGHFYLFGVP